jgi:hypothetical protein
MIPMKAPDHVKSFSYDKTQYPVVEGVLNVPPTVVAHALKHGFKLLGSQNAEEQYKLDLPGAIAKAQAAIPLILMKAPENVKSAVVNGEQYNVRPDGTVAVPAGAEVHLKRHGFEKIADIKPHMKEEDVEVIKEDNDPPPPADTPTSLPTEDELGAMTKAQLVEFLTANKVETPASTKPELFASALDWVKAETERRAEKKEE